MRTTDGENEGGTMIQAIETQYRGYRFRSRIEARWAVLFDTIRTAWEYEPDGYATDHGCYLPDFLITNRFFVEVKPTCFLDGSEEEINRDFKRWVDLSHGTGLPLLTLCGGPGEERFGNFILTYPDGGGDRPNGCGESRIGLCGTCGRLAVAGRAEDGWGFLCASGCPAGALHRPSVWTIAIEKACGTRFERSAHAAP